MNDKSLQLEAVRLLDIIAAEFVSDPMSVACFDLRIVDQAKKVSEGARESGLLDRAWKAHNSD